MKKTLSCWLCAYFFVCNMEYLHAKKDPSDKPINSLFSSETARKDVKEYKTAFNQASKACIEASKNIEKTEKIIAKQISDPKVYSQESNVAFSQSLSFIFKAASVYLTYASYGFNFLQNGLTSISRASKSGDKKETTGILNFQHGMKILTSSEVMLKLLKTSAGCSAVNTIFREPINEILVAKGKTMQLLQELILKLEGKNSLLQSQKILMPAFEAFIGDISDGEVKDAANEQNIQEFNNCVTYLYEYMGQLKSLCDEGDESSAVAIKEKSALEKITTEMPYEKSGSTIKQVNFFMNENSRSKNAIEAIVRNKSDAALISVHLNNAIKACKNMRDAANSIISIIDKQVLDSKKYSEDVDVVTVQYTAMLYSFVGIYAFYFGEALNLIVDGLKILKSSKKIGDAKDVSGRSSLEHGLKMLEASRVSMANFRAGLVVLINQLYLIEGGTGSPALIKEIQKFISKINASNGIVLSMKHISDEMMRFEKNITDAEFKKVITFYNNEYIQQFAEFIERLDTFSGIYLKHLSNKSGDQKVALQEFKGKISSPITSVEQATPDTTDVEEDIDATEDAEEEENTEDETSPIKKKPSTQKAAPKKKIEDDVDDTEDGEASTKNKSSQSNDDEEQDDDDAAEGTEEEDSE